MTTIIRRYGSPAAFSDSIILDLEPPVVWPVAPAGHFRFARSRGFALTNKVRGGPDALVSTADAVTFDDVSASVSAGTALCVPGGMSLPGTLVSVFYQQASGQNQTLVGNPNTSGADSAGLAISAAGAIIAFSRTASSNTSASLLKDGGDRWEFVAATYSAGSTPSVALHRPRTESVVTASPAALPATISTLRILGSSQGTLNGAVRGSLTAYWPGVVLTGAQIAEAYASVKASLATSGIDI